MGIVTLEDNTVYYIDTDKKSQARRVVEYKLNQRLDCRKIKSVEIMEGIIMDKQSKHYNSDREYDKKDLVCAKGWAYKWS